MNRIAIVFTRSPHGTSAGREGLDAALALCALNENIALFFVSDGVLQLLTEQQPARVLARNYVAAFGLLPLYDIDEMYICAASLMERGLPIEGARVLPAKVVSPTELRSLLARFDRIITF
ncbi:sulfurtransferase complex subunit TusC [Erwinia tracheiphila]|uniref:Sulfur relay protein TusC n=1 Tax=Erwinia tracheiphila TaxID=65700 RepID=A0A0M2KCU8_9GAMM|nr:sulfurtransferase complex subunit TusC [Erwinia tracheiphila]AXF78060.1 sulfurtransferase complex subunit TusC [Erwinia tracheiphila]EOS95454.1 tRNA 2-thiouridine synthesizing protein C [Erwinia tracheiphila PSU-1]KKF37195.1 sulfur relay protein TusC [Erwinia tracheiphila]UIA83227.1 sulfurtransferase complex subunit TusC [Erwinia tracheiphila]UIA88585.1 sulfurtransferase complex subunit TusC [Erwinia tracheiphila]